MKSGRRISGFRTGRFPRRGHPRAADPGKEQRARSKRAAGGSLPVSGEGQVSAGISLPAAGAPSAFRSHSR